MDWEVVVVDDGSLDGTAEVVTALYDPSVRLVQHSTNKGYGAALRTGFEAARMDLIFFTDADLQFDAMEIDRLLPWIERFDIVAGYRSPRQDPWVRRANAAAWGLALYGAFGLEDGGRELRFQALQANGIRWTPDRLRWSLRQR